MVNGSFGEAWPPRRNRSDISLYVTDICRSESVSCLPYFRVYFYSFYLCLRSLTLDYEKDVVNSGVSAYRFIGTKKAFSNETEDPDNWCFCSGGVCNPSGVGNSSTCRFGAPVFVSYPHFYLADPYYLDHVSGLNPQKEFHEFFIDLEPVNFNLKSSALERNNADDFS